MVHLVVVEEADISLVGAEGEVHAADSLQVINEENSVISLKKDFGPPSRPLYKFCTCISYLTLGLSWSCNRIARPFGLS